MSKKSERYGVEIINIEYIELQKKEWFNKLLEAEFKGKDIIVHQLENSNVIYEENYSYISIKIHVNEDFEKYPYEVRVPVEMRAFQKNLAPIVFMLHIIDGLVNELEIFTADLSLIDAKNISLDNVEFIIDNIVG